MKHFLLYLLFGKTMRKMHLEKSILKIELAQTKVQLENSKKVVEQVQQRLESVIDFLDSVKEHNTMTTGIDKLGETCYVISSSIMIELYKKEKEYEQYYFRKKAFMNVSHSFDYKDAKKREYGIALKIDNILMTNNQEDCDKGYGSILITQLIKRAKLGSYEFIIGQLSDVDNHDKERRFHFYKKFGFKIEMYDKNRKGMMYAKIRLDLSMVKILSDGTLQITKPVYLKNA